jgi:hypothetical protein
MNSFRRWFTINARGMISWGRIWKVNLRPREKSGDWLVFAASDLDVGRSKRPGVGTQLLKRYSMKLKDRGWAKPELWVVGRGPLFYELYNRVELLKGIPSLDPRLLVRFGDEVRLRGFALPLVAH